MDVAGDVDAVAAIKDVIAAVAFERVVARAAQQGVRVAIADEQVIVRGADQAGDPIVFVAISVTQAARPCSERGGYAGCCMSVTGEGGVATIVAGIAGIPAEKNVGISAAFQYTARASAVKEVNEAGADHAFDVVVTIARGLT